MTPTDHSRPGHGHDALYDESTLHNEEVAHEHSDVNVRALLMFLVGLVVVTGLVQLSMWGLFEFFEKQAQRRDPVMSPLARPAGQYPPEPRLLTDEPDNLMKFRAQQAEALKGIADAKKQLLEHGLPVRANAPTDPWLGTHAPARGESSGGRNIPTTPGAQAPAPQPQPAPAQPAAEPHAPQSGGH